MNAQDKMKRAVTNLILDQPFFGALAIRLRLVADPTIAPTAATDGKILAYNPEFIDTLDIGQTVGLVAHEVLHCANGHIWRCDGRETDTWAKACDYAINSVIKKAGLYLPSDVLLDARFDGQSAEQIYATLKEERQNDPNGDGSGEQDSPGWGEMLDGSGEQDAEQQQAEWKVATLQAAQSAKAQGNLPGGLDRLLDEIKHPAVDWRSALRRFVQQTASADYSWAMPNARYLAGGLYLPSLRSEQMKPLVVAVDTSGSVSTSELQSFAAEIQAIMDDCQPENVTVIYCDYKVQSVEQFDKGDMVTLTPKGGGGTAFDPVFAEVATRGIEPACLIYMTDMAGIMPTESPDYPVLWLNTGQRRRTATFGEVLDFPKG